MFTNWQSAHPTLAAITRPLLVAQVRSDGRRIKHESERAAQTSELSGMVLMKDLHLAHPPMNPAKRHQAAGSPGTEVTVGEAPRPLSASGSAHFRDSERKVYLAL